MEVDNKEVENLRMEVQKLKGENETLTKSLRAQTVIANNCKRTNEDLEKRCTTLQDLNKELSRTLEGELRGSIE
jgi:FtsZ-binding cell division protein ZapB